MHDCLMHYRSSVGDHCESTGIGSSLESSDAEDANFDNETSRLTRTDSNNSLGSCTSSNDSQIEGQENFTAKQFMKRFVDKIFDEG